MNQPTADQQHQPGKGPAIRTEERIEMNTLGEMRTHYMNHLPSSFQGPFAKRCNRKAAQLRSKITTRQNIEALPLEDNDD